jgi:Ca2+/H+ antiporter
VIVLFFAITGLSMRFGGWRYRAHYYNEHCERLQRDSTLIK